MILAAVERRWREEPDQRLGQLLVNVYRAACPSVEPHPLFNLDGKLLELLGAETDDERRYIAGEPGARRRGWRDWEREHRRPANER